MNVEKLTGVVAWFSARKGFGFITPDGNMEEKDVFIHWSGISMQGYKQLKAGDHVEYELKDTPKGVVAIEVKVLKSADTPQPE